MGVIKWRVDFESLESKTTREEFYRSRIRSRLEHSTSLRLCVAPSAEHHLQESLNCYNAAALASTSSSKTSEPR